jgi:hypothetical protein
MSAVNKMKNIFPGAAGANVFGLNAEQIRVGLSSLLASHSVAFIHLTFPSVDNVNHKSRDNLVSRLSGHGFAETAELVANEQPYLAFDDLQKAVRVYHEIQQDSMAVGAALYYAGNVGLAAVEAIRSQLPQDTDSGIHLVTGTR